MSEPILLSMVAIVLAVLALVGGRRRPGEDERRDARLAALEEQIGTLRHRVEQMDGAARAAPAVAVEPPPIPPAPGGLEAPPADPPRPIPPPLPPPLPPPPDARRLDLEQRIGARWATWVGIVAILFAVSFFLKWSFDNDLIGPGARVALGLIAGLALLVAGLVLHRRDDVPFLSEGLAGGGLGVLYLSLFAAHSLYRLMGPGTAFGFMFAVTLAGALVAVVTQRQVIAVLALLGGLLTPLLLRVPHPDERRLLGYLVVLDVLVLLVARFRTWPALNRLAWVGTAGLLAPMLLAEPPGPHPLARVALLTALWAIFVVAPVWRERSEGRRGRELDLGLVVANAAGYFATVYWTLDVWEPRAEVPVALALAVAYRLVSADYGSRVPEDPGTVVVHEGLVWSFLTIAFPLAADDQWVTLGWAVEGLVLMWAASRLATPVAPLGALCALALAAARAGWLDREWQPAVVPVWNLTYLIHLLVVVALAVAGTIALRVRVDAVRLVAREGLRSGCWIAAALLLAGLLWREPGGLWPAGLLTAELLAVAALARLAPAPAWVVSAPLLGLVLLARVMPVLGADDRLARAAAASLVSGPLLSQLAACVALGLAGKAVASAGAWGAQIGRVMSGAAAVVGLLVLSGNWTRYQDTLGLQARRARDFAELGRVEWRTQLGLSVLWTVYAAIALAWGFVRAAPAVRYGALALLGITVVKVFVVDLAAVSTVYRVLSFLVLGIVLLGVSALYQKARRPQ